MPRTNYNKIKQDSAARNREISRDGRDIAPLPEIADPSRREACREDLKLFCETYFPAAFYMGWSDDHLRVIKIIQRSVLNGGLFAVAMPRGNGKTTLCVVAAVWALLYAHRRWVVLIGATETLATKLLRNLVTYFETNELLLADFPEAVYPIKCLDREAKRCIGQLLYGEATRIGWTASELVFPTVKDSACSGARVSVAGITGAVRGMQAVLADGQTIRPDFVLIDDPQTKESAGSPKQIDERLSIIQGDILNLCGPQTTISGVAPVTVVRKGDVADQLLDRKKNPAWQGVRTKMLLSEPKNLKLWEKYAELWADEQRAERGIKAATEFYIANRDEMDDGAVASWQERFKEGEASAVQCAMNIKLLDEAVFAAEFQNEPLSLEDVLPLMLTGEQIAAKIMPGIKRGIVPSYATKLTGFIDVQGSVLYYGLVAVGSDFSCHLIDYGTWPKQPQNHFTLRGISQTLESETGINSTEGAIRAGLERLSKQLLDAKWQRNDGGPDHQVDRLLIDSGYHQGIVKQFIREAGAYRMRLMASKGYGVKSDQNPLDTWQSKPGDRRGWGWIYNRTEEHVIYDTNLWKTFLAERLRMSAGESGNMSIFAGTSGQHKMLVEHLSSEFPTPTEGKGRKVNVWKLRVNRENHLLDCAVGALVAGSEQGILYVGHQPQSGAIKRPRRKLEVSF
jgi:hypothetical protein